MHWRHLRAILLLPIMVTVVIPVMLLIVTGSLNFGWGLPAPLAVLVVLIGVVFIAAGRVLIFRTIRLFAESGEGTLAPWDPTQKLVVVGVYRYVRNPMISGVMSILLGESLFLGSIPVLIWFAIFTGINLLYIPLVEEPGLVARFGDDYLAYRAHVPRWIPRLHDPYSG